MPGQESIAANKISERMLIPHLRKRKGGSTSLVVITEDVETSENSYINFVCSASVSAGQALFMTSGGTVEPADYSNNKPAFAVAVDNGISGQEIRTLSIGQISISNVTFEKGKTVWLDSGDQNVSTSFPILSSGDIIQKIGTSINTSEILLGIEHFEIFE